MASTNDDLILLSVATKGGGYFEAFKYTTAVHNFDTNIIGWGREWQGWVKRLEWINEAIEQVEDDKPILVCDAYDVFMTASSKEVTEKFMRMNCKCLISAESYAGDIFQKNVIANFYNRSDMPYNTSETYSYVCAGAVMYLNKRVWIEEIYPTLHSLTVKYQDDQKAFTTLTLSRPDLIKTDHHCEIFQNIGQVLLPIFNPSSLFKDPHQLRLVATEENDEQAFRYINDEFATTPVIFHGPGSVQLSHLIYQCYPGMKDHIDLKDYSMTDRLSKAMSYIPQITHQIGSEMQERWGKFVNSIKVTFTARD